MELYKYPIQEPSAEQHAEEIYEFILPKIEHYAEWKAVIRILGLREKFADLSDVPKEFEEQMTDREPLREVAEALKLLLLACKEGKFSDDHGIFAALGKYPYLTYETLLLVCDTVVEGKKLPFFEQVKQFVKNPVVPKVWARSFLGEKYLASLTKYLEESIQASYALQQPMEEKSVEEKG